MTLRIKGMMCSHCAARVKKALEALPGVSAEVDHVSGTAQITCPDTVSPETLKQAVTGAGYEVVD